MTSKDIFFLVAPIICFLGFFFNLWEGLTKLHKNQDKAMPYFAWAGVCGLIGIILGIFAKGGWMLFTEWVIVVIVTWIGLRFLWQGSEKWRQNTDFTVDLSRDAKPKKLWDTPKIIGGFAFLIIAGVGLFYITHPV